MNVHSIGYLKYPVKAFFEPSGGKIVKLFVMSLLENISRGKMWASVIKSNTESGYSWITTDLEIHYFWRVKLPSLPMKQTSVFKPISRMWPIFNINLNINIDIDIDNKHEHQV